EGEHERRGEGVEDHPDEESPLRAKLSARTPEGDDEERGGKRPQDRGKLGRQQANPGGRGDRRRPDGGSTGCHGQRGADRRASGEAEDERIGERIAQERLQRGAGDGERRADLGGEQHPRKAQAQDHRGVRFHAAQRTRDRGVSGPEGKTSRGGEREQGNEHAEGERRARGGRSGPGTRDPGSTPRTASSRSSSASTRRGPGWSSAWERSGATRTRSSPGTSARPWGGVTPARTRTSGA